MEEHSPGQEAVITPLRAMVGTAHVQEVHQRVKVVIRKRVVITRQQETTVLDINGQIILHVVQIVRRYRTNVHQIVQRLLVRRVDTTLTLLADVTDLLFHIKEYTNGASGAIELSAINTTAKSKRTKSKGISVESRSRIKARKS